MVPYYLGIIDVRGLLKMRDCCRATGRAQRFLADSDIDVVEGFYVVSCAAEDEPAKAEPPTKLTIDQHAQGLQFPMVEEEPDYAGDEMDFTLYNKVLFGKPLLTM